MGREPPHIGKDREGILQALGGTAEGVQPLWRRWLGAWFGGFFAPKSAEAPVRPSDDLVRLIQVLDEEPNLYHLFMYLATAPVEVRRRHLDELSERVAREGGDARMAMLVNELRDPRVFEAVYRTLQRLRR